MKRKQTSGCIPVVVWNQMKMKSDGKIYMADLGKGFQNFIGNMELLYGELSDIDSWMELVGQVRWNFPGLESAESVEEHKMTVIKFMKKKQALCVKVHDGVVGVLLFSRSKNMICCLAVSPEHRRQGIASVLLEKALSELDRI